MYLSDLQLKRPLWRYTTAIVAIALAILIRYALVPMIGSKPAYITIFPAILIVAMLAGCAPALLTGLIGSAIAAHLFSPRPLHITYIEITSITLSALLAGFLAQQLHSSIERITESESFYHQTIESIPGLVFALKPDGSYEYVSRQASAYTGVPQNQELADRWTELVHPQDRRRAVAAWLTRISHR